MDLLAYVISLVIVGFLLACLAIVIFIIIGLLQTEFNRIFEIINGEK